jgi:hypothetical protein
MTELEVLLAALSKARVSFVIIGGVAATLHGSARLTNDLDVVYDRSVENIERLSAALAPFQPYLRGAPEGRPRQARCIPRKPIWLGRQGSMLSREANLASASRIDAIGASQLG